VLFGVVAGFYVLNSCLSPYVEVGEEGSGSARGCHVGIVEGYRDTSAAPYPDSAGCGWAMETMEAMEEAAPSLSDKDPRQFPFSNKGMEPSELPG
jgi:hypothetical protein